MGYLKQKLLKKQQIEGEKKLHLNSFDLHRQIDENLEYVDCTPEEMEIDTDAYYSGLAEEDRHERGHSSSKNIRD